VPATATIILIHPLVTGPKCWSAMPPSDIPNEYREYSCDEYFAKGWSTRGHFDDVSRLWVIAPLPEAYLDRTVEFFAIGRSGCGGIDFGYRKGQPGLWAYYPIDRDFKYMAATIPELVDGWCSGRLSV
jgi:hypothetical protein